MLVRLVSFLSAVVLFLLAVLIGALGGGDAAGCFLGSVGLAVTGGLAPRALQSLQRL